jgi:hypothetical protein
MRRLLLALAVLVLAMPVLGHGAPSPKDQDTRLLHDHNDDCGGDDAGSLSNCRGSHDLIALDVREAHDASLGDVVVFRLILNGGSGNLRDVLTLKAGGSSKTFEFATSNNQQFTGTGFDRVSTAQSIGDGTRFAVEGTVQRSTLGGLGAKLSDFRVEAYTGSTMGDFMPGTYRTALGNAPTGSAEQGEPTSYVRPDYALRGPAYYVTTNDPGAARVAKDSETIVQFDVRNALRSTPQSITGTVSGADGVTARFHAPSAASGTGYSDTLRVDLRGGQSTVAHLAVTGVDEGARGTLVVVLSTDLGGRTELAIPYTVQAGSAPPPSPPPAPPADNDRGAPAPGLLVAFAGLALAALARRRA